MLEEYGIRWEKRRERIVLAPHYVGIIKPDGDSVA